MLDENLPTFVIKASKDRPKTHSSYLFSQFGNDFEAAYSLRHLDPEQLGSRNRYAVALYDAHNPEVLFAEVLLIPDWTQPTLSQDEIRRNGGVTPAPEPILPTEFIIQLYNPDQQILVKHKPASLTSAATWEFDMPTQSFRTPSHSSLDRSQHDPAISELTPKLSMKWKKDGRLSKDLGCYLSGKALNPDGSKNKHKEPDITIAILKGLKEVTMYEPNMSRVEIEDLKGFEVTLLLGAVVIRDVYFGSMKDTFNLAGGRKASNGPSTVASAVPILSQPQPGGRPTTSPTQREPRVPPTDPRTQWEIDQETERLRKVAAAEAREQKKREEAEQRQIKKMLEDEEREQRRQQAEIDKETDRLRRLYGPQGNVPVIQAPQHHRHSASFGSGSAYASQAGPSAPYMSGGASQSAFLQPVQPKLKQKSSIFGFRRHSDQDTNKLAKKRSAMW